MNPIKQPYPNIFNDEYPVIVGCPTTGDVRPDTIKAFMRFCPANVTVDHVSYFKQMEKQCQWHVNYNFNKNIELHDVNEIWKVIKEPFDVRVQISLTDDGLVKIIYKVKFSIF